MGVKGIDDRRDRLALEIMTLLRQKGALANNSDPYVLRCYGHGNYPDLDPISLPSP